MQAAGSSHVVIVREGECDPPDFVSDAGVGPSASSYAFGRAIHDPPSKSDRALFLSDVTGCVTPIAAPALLSPDEMEFLLNLDSDVRVAQPAVQCGLWTCCRVVPLDRAGKLCPVSDSRIARVECSPGLPGGAFQVLESCSVRCSDGTYGIAFRAPAPGPSRVRYVRLQLRFRASGC